MKSIDGRLSKLEHRFGIAAPRYLVIVTDRDLGPAEDVYLKILDENEFLPAGAGFGAVDFTLIPSGLSAKEAETFVRENGAKIRGSQLPTIKKDDRHPSQARAK